MYPAFVIRVKREHRQKTSAMLSRFWLLKGWAFWVNRFKTKFVIKIFFTDSSN